MAIGITAPGQKVKESYNHLKGATGAGTGALAGATAGSAVAPGIGTVIGGLAGGISGLLSGKTQESAAPAAQLPTSDSAISRRLQASQGDQLQQLREGAYAVAQAPPEIRKEYGSPIMQAYLASLKQQGVA